MNHWAVIQNADSYVTLLWQVINALSRFKRFLVFCHFLNVFNVKNFFFNVFESTQTDVITCDITDATKFIADRVNEEGNEIGRVRPVAWLVTAYGCANLDGTLQHALVRRHGDTTSVRCLATGETFFLTCIESRWVGELGNCSAPARGTIHTSMPLCCFAY